MKPHSQRKHRAAPCLADRLQAWFVDSCLLESLQGDLHEEFTYQVGRYNPCCTHNIGEHRIRTRDNAGFIVVVHRAVGPANSSLGRGNGFTNARQYSCPTPTGLVLLWERVRPVP